jgi:hypothetical protein
MAYTFIGGYYQCGTTRWRNSWNIFTSALLKRTYPCASRPEECAIHSGIMIVPAGRRGQRRLLKHNLVMWAASSDERPSRRE